MNGPSNVTLANTNSNTSELYLVTMNQGAEQMENLDAVQNQISSDQVYLGGPQFIEITSKVAPNVGQYDYAEPEMPMDESEPISDNHSSEPASHAEYSEIEEKLDQMDAEIKRELRRLSMEKEVNMLVVEQVKQPPNQAATDKPSLKYKIVKSRPAAVPPPWEPVLPPRDSSGRFLPMKSTSRKENRQSISPNYPPTSPQNDNQSSSSHSNQSHEEAADEAHQDESNKHKDESMSLTDNEQQREEETLGRKRRRRQKNRYFLDFHCSDLTKGTRSKDDIDAYTAATGGGSSAMRSSSRRATVDPSKSSDPAPQVKTDEVVAVDTSKSSDPAPQVKTDEVVAVDTSKSSDPAPRVKTDEGVDLLNPDRWTPDEVAEFISQKGFPLEAEVFRSQAIDGISLLLMQRSDFTSGLRLKTRARDKALQSSNQASRGLLAPWNRLI